MTRFSPTRIKLCGTPNIFGYLDNLYSQHIENIRPHMIKEKGQLLRKAKRTQV
jgi:hypothetical protein